MIYESIVNRRSIRKFKQQAVPREILRKCVDAARLSPCGQNRQPLRYIVVEDKKFLPEVFRTLGWSKSIPGFKHTPDEVPPAYIVILLDKSINQDAGMDCGIAAMSICMTAYDEGVASCMLVRVDREMLKANLRIPDPLQVLLVIALGYPAEKSKAVEMKGNDRQYFYDQDWVLNVPKKRFEDIVVWNTY